MGPLAFRISCLCRRHSWGAALEGSNPLPIFWHNIDPTWILKGRHGFNTTKRSVHRALYIQIFNVKNPCQVCSFNTWTLLGLTWMIVLIVAIQIGKLSLLRFPDLLWDRRLNPAHLAIRIVPRAFLQWCRVDLDMSALPVEVSTQIHLASKLEPSARARVQEAAKP